MAWKLELEDPVKVVAFGWAEADVAVILAAIDGFLAAREVWQEDDSSRNRLAKIEARKAVKEAMRDFANSSIRCNRKMKEEEQRYLGVHGVLGRTKRHRHIEPPLAVPSLEPHAGTPGQIIVSYRAENRPRPGKPEHVHGVMVYYAISDHRPTSREDLVHFCFGSRSPLYLNFGEEDRGKRVYMYGCWQIERGGKQGPPGEIVSCYIP
jgi:hypothetical protein